jgi:flagellum-specific peptidoglycan hydrolase FlgJ
LPTANILGLSALESGWGKGRFAKEGNNFFSLHYPASLAIGSLPAKGDKNVLVAKFASYADSAESFRLDYGSIVQNISDPAGFARALQDAGKYGINRDGTKVSTFVKELSNTVAGLALRLDCER